MVFGLWTFSLWGHSFFLLEFSGGFSVRVCELCAFILSTLVTTWQTPTREAAILYLPEPCLRHLVNPSHSFAGFPFCLFSPVTHSRALFCCFFEQTSETLPGMSDWFSGSYNTEPYSNYYCVKTKNVTDDDFQQSDKCIDTVLIDADFDRCRTQYKYYSPSYLQYP